MSSSVHVYSQDPATLDELRQIADGLGMTVHSREVEANQIIGDAADWVMPPDIVLLDMSGSDDVVGRLEHLSAEAPAQSSAFATIILSDDNDARLARKLGERGVDYLVKPLEREEVINALTSASAGQGSDIDISKIVTVTSAQGGSGTSSVAAMLAARSAGNGNRTLLLDLDFMTPGQRSLHGIEKSAAVMDKLREPARLDRSSLENLIAPAGSDLFLLSGEGDLSEPPGADGLAKLLAVASRCFDRVVVDLPHHATWACSTIGMSARTILVTRPTVDGVLALQQRYEDTKAKAPDRGLVLCINDAIGLRKHAVEQSQFSARFDQAEIASLTHDPVSVSQAGLSADWATRSGKISKALPALEALIAPHKSSPNHTKRGPISSLIAWLNN